MWPVSVCVQVVVRLGDARPGKVFWMQQLLLLIELTTSLEDLSLRPCLHTNVIGCDSSKTVLRTCQELGLLYGDPERHACGKEKRWLKKAKAIQKARVTWSCSLFSSGAGG